MIAPAMPFLSLPARIAPAASNASCHRRIVHELDLDIADGDRNSLNAPPAARRHGRTFVSEPNDRAIFVLLAK